MAVYIIPFIAAIIGWCIIHLFTNMLFAPARVQKLASSMGGLLATQIASGDSIKSSFKDPEKLKTLTPTIEAHLDTFLQVKLQEKLPVIATFVGESTLAKIKEAMIEEIDLLLPVVIEEYAGSLASNMDIEKLANERMMQIPPFKLSGILKNALKRELLLLKISVAALCFIISVVSMYAYAMLLVASLG